jgi:hypothetical protein
MLKDVSGMIYISIRPGKYAHSHIEIPASASGKLSASWLKVLGRSFLWKG